MANASNISAWIALAFALYSIAAGIGLLGAPGRWKRMALELDQSAALGFLTGIMVFALGTAIVLVNPCNDWLSFLVSAIGVGMVLEGLAFLALPRFMGRLSRSLLDGDRLNRLWAGLAILIGAGLGLAAIVHLQLPH
ncbi:MAG: hypothetical protein HKN78_12635 [Sphingomonadaceae bacterium]|nr:hypothetical protein [Sphingomonadaceae bacterium]